MKKARLRKVLIILIIAIAILLSLSIRGYAATKMMDEAVVSTYNALGTDAGIYQTAINCYMDTNKTIDTAIANTRTYYGAGETLKVRFSFSREVASGSNLRLGLRFGDGIERVATNPEIRGSYVIFSYNIQNSDYFGGLTLTFIEGTITDTSGNTISLGIQGSENTWTNTIIAKGEWTGVTISDRQIIFPENAINGEDFINKLQGGAYILENSGRIRKMVESDVFILNTTDGSYTAGNSDNIEITYATTGDTNAVAKVRPKDDSSIILIDKVCDIAGNVKGVCNGWNEVYIIPCEGNLVNGKYYYKEGKTIKFLSVGSLPLTQFEIGGVIKTATVEKKLLSSGKDNNNIYISTYIIQNGDNGSIYYTNGNYIADTTAPIINFDGISLQSGTAYYSPTDRSGDNTNGASLTVNENKASGTIWLRKGAKISFSYSASDEIGIDSTASAEARIDLISEEGLYNPTRNISDYAGNIVCFSLSNYVTVLCDETGPNININPTTGSQKQDAIDFTITPSDSNIKNATQYKGSGVQSGDNYKVVDISNVMVSNGTIIANSTSGNNLNIRVMPNGDGYVSVYVPAEVTTDNLKNLSQASEIAKVYVDRKAPVINDVVGVPTNWTREATLSVVASDEGIGGIQYSFNGGAYSTNNTYKVTANGNVRIKVKDGLGNESEEKIVHITKIDNIAPTIVAVDQKQISQYSTELTIKANDAESGLAEYSFDGGASWQTSPTKIYTEAITIGANQLKVKDKVGNIGSYGSAVSVVISGTAPIIKIENNGGDYIIPTGENVAKVHPTIEVDTENNCTIYYAVSESNTTEPTNYANVVANKVQLNIDMTQGTWYLWIYAVDNISNIASTQYVSEAFTVRPAIIFDTTEESCITKVETINGVNYVIVPVNTTVNDLLKCITSPYKVTIKMSDSNKEVAGDSKLATNEMIVINSINEEHRVVVKGDVTGNGKIGLGDLTKLNQYRLNKIALDRAEFLAGDVTEDGKISLGDITKLNQYRLNKINEL